MGNRAEASIVHITNEGYVYATYNGVTKLLGLRAVGNVDLTLPTPAELGCESYVIVSNAFNSNAIGTEENVVEPYKAPFVS